MFLCVRDLRRQRSHERRFALDRVTGFERVVVLGHVRAPYANQRLRRL